MNTFFATIIIGISLSMDAFSLSLIYGTLGMKKKEKIILSLIVGSYHFFMPLLGLSIGELILKALPFRLNILITIIFFIIGIEMIISSLGDKEEKTYLTFFGYFLFGLSVSIDSFTIGIGLNIINNNYLQVALTFALISGSFTYIGLNLGDKLNNKFGKIATAIGGISLIILGIYYFFS